MKRFVAIILALALFSAYAAVVSAADNGDNILDLTDMPISDSDTHGDVMSDEIGDYVVYEQSGMKMYVRFNPGIELFIDDNGAFYVVDADGNKVSLSYEINIDENPRAKELWEEYERSHYASRDEGMSGSIPQIDDYDDQALPVQGGDGNPSTGLTLAVLPVFAGLALAVLGKKPR